MVLSGARYIIGAINHNALVCYCVIMLLWYSGVVSGICAIWCALYYSGYKPAENSPGACYSDIFIVLIYVLRVILLLCYMCYIMWQADGAIWCALYYIVYKQQYFGVLLCYCVIVV